MGAALLAVKSGFILFMKDYQFSLQINTLERERDRKRERCLLLDSPLLFFYPFSQQA
jgi:hypothetical protein